MLPFVNDMDKKILTPFDTNISNTFYMAKDDKKPERLTPAQSCFQAILNKTYVYLPNNVRFVTICGDTMGVFNSHKRIEYTYAGFYPSNDPKSKDKPIEIVYGIKPEHRYMIYTDLYPFLNVKFNQLNKMFKSNHDMFADYISMYWDRKERKYRYGFYYNNKYFDL